MKYLLTTILVLMFSFNNVFAALVAKGTIQNVGVNPDNIVVNIVVTPGSPCSSGYFFSYDQDTSATAVNRLLALALAAQARKVEVSIFVSDPLTVVCDHTNSSKFTSFNIHE